MIAILMATYNGEKYIETQLKSILCQTIQDWMLYIRDDGSTDGTLSVIYKFIEKDSRIKLVSDIVEHRGAGNSFMWLLSKVNADYYMFCDQDDYWLPNKIESTINRMDSIEKERGNSIPVIVHSDVKVADADLSIMSDSLYKFMGQYNRVQNAEALLIGNIAIGCTIMINAAAKKIMFPYEKYAIMHDYWMALKVYVHNGVVSFIETPTMLYRQHGNNTLGATRNVSTIYKLIHLKLYFSNFRECWIMSHRLSRLSFIKFLFLKVRYNYMKK